MPTFRPTGAALIVSWVAQIAVAVILVQTLYFKFTYAPETAYIFDSRGGRPAATVIGCFELLAAVLLLVPRTAPVGALIAMLVIAGAIVTHLTDLGIQVVDPATGEKDGGLLFGLAIAVAVGSLIVLTLQRWVPITTSQVLSRTLVTTNMAIASYGRGLKYRVAISFYQPRQRAENLILWAFPRR